MNIFDFRHRLIDDYSSYTRSFIEIQNPLIRKFVKEQLDAGVLWPESLIQLNPSFEAGESIDELVAQGVLHDQCRRVFSIKPDPQNAGQPLRLHRHQSDAVRVAKGGHPYILTTGTGSGKSLRADSSA